MSCVWISILELHKILDRFRIQISKKRLNKWKVENFTTCLPSGNLVVQAYEDYKDLLGAENKKLKKQCWACPGQSFKYIWIRLYFQPLPRRFFKILVDPLVFLVVCFCSFCPHVHGHLAQPMHSCLPLMFSKCSHVFSATARSKAPQR